jgi:inhibitor of KinA
MAEYKVLLAGDTALVVDFGDRVDLQLSAKVLALARRLTALHIPGVIETVPTIRSLIIYYEPLSLPAAALQEHILRIVQDLPTAESAARTWQLPVCYDPALAPDLGDVADKTGLSQDQVVALHSSVTYHVYMLGFLPGLAYLGDVPAQLGLPRRQNPRPKIAGGSVGIAGNLTCIYPMDTPCGWHLLGRSPVPLWDLRRDSAALLAAGDKVKLKPISLREYERDLSSARSDPMRVHEFLESAV